MNATANDWRYACYMKTLTDQTKRTRPRTPNNQTTTAYRISDALWAVLEPLLPVHVHTHRFGGGRPRVPNRHDMKLTQPTLETLVAERPTPTPDRPQSVCLDAGYNYQEVRDFLADFGLTAHIRSRGDEARELKHKAGSRARRWVVERSHSWLNRFRRILIRWEKKPENYIGFLHFACALI